MGHSGYYSWKSRCDAVGRGRDGVIQHFSMFETTDEKGGPSHGDAGGAIRTKKRPAPNGGRHKGQDGFGSLDRGASRARTTSETEVLAPGESACGVSFDTVLWNAGGIHRRRANVRRVGRAPVTYQGK